MAFLELNNASVAFGPYTNETVVLKDINLKVEESEFVAIIKKSNDNLTGLAKVAFFEGDNSFSDVRQFTLNLSYNF